jgi:predicted O-methyltransferase YrrM
MYSLPQLLFKYLNYWFTASNGRGHGIHSPFVFEFITKVLNGTKDEVLYRQIESRRTQLLQDDTTITIEDFGAGSRVIGTKQRKIKQIAATSLKPKKYSQLLHRIARHYRPDTALEIGTSLGITTAYLAKADPGANIITMEGAEEIAAIARRNFDVLGITNIQQVTGNFEETLAPTLAGIDKADLVFIDGNHRYEPTIRYFSQVLEKSHDHTIIILDDIYWSKEMEQAWQWVKAHEQTRLTIDLFAIGIVILRPDILHKQHFRVRY